MYLKTVMSKEPLSQYLEETVIMDSQGSREVIVSEDYNINEIIPGTQTDYENVIEDGPILCPCDCKKDSGTVIVHCIICMKGQHSICYGILNTEDNLSPFNCVECINVASFSNSQLDKIYWYEGRDQQELCGLRRALVFCTSLKHLTTNQLEKQLGCSKQFAKNLIERMELEEFIRKGITKGKYIVNEQMILCKGYQEYFPAYENKENSAMKKLIKTAPAIHKQTKVLSNQMSRRRPSTAMIENDESDELKKQSGKKKCIRAKEAIELMD